MDQWEKPAWDDNEKNVHTVICQVCKSSKILLSGTAKHVEMEYALPPMRKKKDSDKEEEKEMLHDWWVVDEINAFENIAVSYKVEDIKYLACADCENGPVGYHDLNTSKSYIAHARVLHKQPVAKN